MNEPLIKIIINKSIVAIILHFTSTLLTFLMWLFIALPFTNWLYSGSNPLEALQFKNIGRFYQDMHRQRIIVNHLLAIAFEEETCFHSQQQHAKGLAKHLQSNYLWKKTQKSVSYLYCRLFYARFLLLDSHRNRSWPSLGANCFTLHFILIYHSYLNFRLGRCLHLHQILSRTW